jgi:hypothetical protein
VDESTLPPPDKSADAIAEFDVDTQKVSRISRRAPIPKISPSARMEKPSMFPMKMTTASASSTSPPAS